MAYLPPFGMGSEYRRPLGFSTLGLQEKCMCRVPSSLTVTDTFFRVLFPQCVQNTRLMSDVVLRDKRLYVGIVAGCQDSHGPGGGNKKQGRGQTTSHPFLWVSTQEVAGTYYMETWRKLPQLLRIPRPDPFTHGGSQAGRWAVKSCHCQGPHSPCPLRICTSSRGQG